MVLHLSNDLMLVGKVSSWAKSNDIAYKSVSSIVKFQTLLGEGSVQRVLVDLQFKSLDIADAAAMVKQADAEMPLFGYAQHVMTDLIQSANDSGFDRVLTRGQFDRGFSELMV